MGALNRIRAAFSWLGKMVSGPADIVRGVMSGGSWSEPPIRGTREMVEGYESMPWLRACADKASTALACVDLELYQVKPVGAARAVRDRALQNAGPDARRKLLAAARRRKALQPVEDHPLWTMLDNPNPFMGRMGLIKLFNTYLDLVGDSFWLKERNALGVWVGTWPVPPNWVIETPTPTKPTYRVSWKSWQAIIPETEIAWCKEIAPANPYGRGAGIGWVLGDEYETDEYASKMAKALFYNRAKPDFLVMPPDAAAGWTQEEIDGVERDWLNKHEGFYRAHKPHFLNQPVQIKEFTQQSLESLVYPALRKTERDLIIQVWGIPPEMFGIAEKGGLQRVNYEGAEYMFGKYCTLPRAERLRGFLQREAEREYDERIVVDYVAIVPADKAYELSVMKAAPHAFTVDEWRARAGEEPIGGDEGKAMLIPMNSVLTDDPLKDDPEPVPVVAPPVEEPAENAA